MHGAKSLCNPMDCWLLCSWTSQARILECVVIPSLGDLPDPVVEPASPALQADSLPLSYLEAILVYISKK